MTGTTAVPATTYVGGTTTSTLGAPVSFGTTGVTGARLTGNTGTYGTGSNVRFGYANTGGYTTSTTAVGAPLLRTSGVRVSAPAPQIVSTIPVGTVNTINTVNTVPVTTSAIRQGDNLYLI